MADIVAQIRAQQANLPAFKFYKNNSDEQAALLAPSTKIADLTEDGTEKIVYVRPVPAAGAYSHGIAAIFSFSLLNN